MSGLRALHILSYCYFISSSGLLRKDIIHLRMICGYLPELHNGSSSSRCHLAPASIGHLKERKWKSGSPKSEVGSPEVGSRKSVRGSLDGEVGSFESKERSFIPEPEYLSGIFIDMCSCFTCLCRIVCVERQSGRERAAICILYYYDYYYYYILSLI